MANVVANRSKLTLQLFYLFIYIITYLWIFIFCSAKRKTKRKRYIFLFCHDVFFLKRQFLRWTNWDERKTWGVGKGSSNVYNGRKLFFFLYYLHIYICTKTVKIRRWLTHEYVCIHAYAGYCINVSVVTCMYTYFSMQESLLFIVYLFMFVHTNAHPYK